MRAAIITIGDEILIGQIADTNSSFIAKSLDMIGVETFEMVSVSDNRDHILSSLKKFQDQVDFVIITGGLGPTKDDITKKTFCDYFQDVLVVDKKVLAHVTKLIEDFYKRPISQINKDQALVPSQSIVLHNEMGTAPGLWMKKGSTVFVALPGVPYEMAGLIEEVVVPKIVKEYNRPYIIHKTIYTYGVGESLLAERIEDWENSLPDFIKLAYLPSPGVVKLRLTARGTDERKLQNAIEENVYSLTQILGQTITGFDEKDTLEVVLGRQLAERNKTLATAESCTGGAIASKITSVPGVSNCFKGSVVCYSTQIKIDVLGIPKSVIDEHTVVSAEVAEAMALNIKKMMETDYAIATTGNAGPDKGDSDAEIGTVFIALATPKEVIVEKFNFGQPREKVIDRAVNKSFEILNKEILKNVL